MQEEVFDSLRGLGVAAGAVAEGDRGSMDVRSPIVEPVAVGAESHFHQALVTPLPVIKVGFLVSVGPAPDVGSSPGVFLPDLAPMRDLSEGSKGGHLVGLLKQ